MTHAFGEVLFQTCVLLEQSLNEKQTAKTHNQQRATAAEKLRELEPFAPGWSPAACPALSSLPALLSGGLATPRPGMHRKPSISEKKSAIVDFWMACDFT
jgi:hypothetical protein